MRGPGPMMPVVILSAFFGCTTIAVGQDGQGKSPPKVTAKQAMDYFAGDWRGLGVQGTFQYKGRERAEWDLHHNIMSHRTEFFGGTFANTLMVIRRWDSLENMISEHQFASWGVYREGQYKVVPHGEWFQLVGVCKQTGKNGRKTSFNIITVHDENHYTWSGVPQLGFSGDPLLEDYSREGFEPRPDRTNRTDEYLREVIRVQEESPNVDETELVNLRGALAQFLMRQNRYAEAVKVLEERLALQTRLLTPEDPAVEETTSAIVRACRNGTYDSCMDAEASDQDFRIALKMAKKAARLAPDDQRMWLQAFAHYRLGEAEAALQAIRESASSDMIWPGVLLLAAMIENNAGNDELADALFALGNEMASKNSAGDVQKWTVMASEAIGETLVVNRMDKQARLNVYETVIDGYPGLAEAYRLRGRFYGGLADWRKALADYRQAAELSPNKFRYREGEAAITLRLGTPEERDAICQKLLEEWSESNEQTPRMDTVVMCSLAPAASVDRQRLAEIADEVLASMEARAFLTVGKGMSLYRLKRYQEAVDTISTEGSVNPKDTILGHVFLAMAHKQLGHEAKARQILRQARAEADQQLAAPGGKPLKFQDRPVVWCMVHSALQEAEQLINVNEARIEETSTQ